MPHRNAPLSETGRLPLARCVVEDGWPLRRAAERFQVSPTTAKRWADRYRHAGPAGMGEILTDETKHTAAGFWTRAQAFFTDCGITVLRVLTDNGSCY